MIKEKINNLSNTVVLGTAHPYKFLETVKMATGKEVKPPIQLSKIEDKEEKYDILENDISKIKNYIYSKGLLVRSASIVVFIQGPTSILGIGGSDRKS